MKRLKRNAVVAILLVVGGLMSADGWTELRTSWSAGDSEPLRFWGLLQGLGLFFSGVYLLWFFRFARKKVGELCVVDYEYEIVDARDFKQLDFAYYEDGRRVLEHHGYRFLADYEQLVFRRNSGLRIAIRVLISQDGSTSAGIWHLRQRWYLRALGVKDAKAIDLETKLSNGEWLVTSNAQAAGALDQPPGIDAIHLPNGTCFEMMIESHHKRIALYVQKHPGVEPVRVATLEDVHRLQAELQRIKAEYRRANGLTKQELQRIAGVDPSEGLDIVHEGIAAGHKPDQRKSA
jgi:hypothetical protein